MQMSGPMVPRAHSLSQRHGQCEEGVGQSYGGEKGIHSDANHSTRLDLHLRQR